LVPMCRPVAPVLMYQQAVLAARVLTYRLPALAVLIPTNRMTVEAWVLHPPVP